MAKEYDFSDWLNQIVPKHSSESEQDHYYRLVAMSMAVEFYHQQNRCVTCEHYANQKCNNYHQEMTVEQAYTPNQCAAYLNRIPF